MKVEQSVIDEIKRSVDVLQYIGARVKLRKNGKDYFGLCPFHKDTKPSFIVDPQKQLWNCLGACSGNGGKSGGDIISFVMKQEGCSFPQAVERLSPRRAIAVHPEIKRKAPALLSLVIDAYHRSFLESRSAQEYISGRGIDPALAKQYRAGYVDGSLLERVSRESSDYRMLQQIGIITEAGNEFFRSCLVFPLTAFNQCPVSMYGRAIGKDLHLYLPPRRGLFNWTAAKNDSEIILAESIIDALSFIRCGFLNVLPIYGVNGFTQEHIDFLVRHKTQKVILAFDSDEAGKQAAAKIAGQLSSMKIDAQVIELPAKDANELLQKEGVEGFKKTIAELLQLKEKTSVSVASSETAASPVTNGEMIVSRESRCYQVRGIPKKAYSRLRVAIHITLQNGANYRDTVDLLSARGREAFAARIAGRFEISAPLIEADLSAILDAIETYQREPEAAKPDEPEITQAEKSEALSFLKSPDLLDRIAADMQALGYVGEEANKKLGYLASISRFLDEPISIVILSQSGSGKSYLAEVLEMLTAPEDMKMFSRLTPQALYYMEKDALCHKFVIIEERAGSADADYSIRSLQSRKRLILAVPIKDPATGKIQTTVFEIYGPTAFLETTTSAHINYENSTRCFEMYLDESAQQTEAIHRMQRFAKTIEGRKLQAQKEALMKTHHNAQRLLQKLLVVIPYAEKIEFPAAWLRTRRDHQRFLNLIEVTAFLHQYQKEIKTDRQTGRSYIEADLKDYEIACKLAEEILPETLSDMKKPVSDFLAAIDAYTEKKIKGQKLSKYDVFFTRRGIREETGLPNYRIKELFHELEELEYVEVEKNQRGSSFRYRLIPGKSHEKVSTLLKADQLQAKIRKGKSG